MKRRTRKEKKPLSSIGLRLASRVLFHRARKRPITAATRKKQRFVWISELPDDILLSILSSLTLKDAAISSLVSRRWRNLCRSITCLNFDMENKFGFFSYDNLRVPLRTRKRQAKMLAFVNWVNGILRLHTGSKIDEFGVCYHLTKDVAPDIDRWISFALGKRVRKLELKLQCGHRVEIHAGLYTFPPHEIMDDEVFSVKQLSLNGCIIGPHGLGVFKSLVTLSLRSVEINDAIFGNLLSNCKLLEHLELCYCQSLVHLRVVGITLRLKLLEIYGCADLKSVSISATNLVSFRYRGLHETKLSLWCIPQLVELRYDVTDLGPSYYKITHAFNELGSNLMQLETLVLHCDSIPAVKSAKLFPTLPNLKTLVLLAEPFRLNVFDGFPQLLQACPNLQRLDLHLSHCKRKWKMPSAKGPGSSPFKHECLGMVEISGFVGQKFDVELAVYLIKTTVSLERITIDPHDKSLYTRWLVCETKGMRKARKLAEQLRTQLPSTAELVVL